MLTDIANHSTSSDMPSASNADHDGRYRTEDELASTINGAGATFIGIEAGTGSPTVTDLQAYLNNTGSSGFFIGGVLSDGGGGTLDVTAGEGFIRASADSNAPLLSFKWSASAGIAVSDDSTEYVFVDDTGSISLSSNEFLEAQDNILIGVVTKESGIIESVFSLGVRLEESIGQAGRLVRRVLGIVRDNSKGGLIFGQSGDANRDVTVSEGILWWGRTEYPIAVGGFDTAGADTFLTYSANGQEDVAASQWPNEEYDNAGVLTEMTNNRWAVLWFYLEPDDHVVMVYGRDQYVTKGQAEEEGFPSENLPSRITSSAILAARFVFQKSANTATITSTFGIRLPGAGVTDHSGLATLAWTSAGHTGTASTIASFDGAGVAAELTIGSDIQAWDAQLDSLSTLTAGEVSQLLNINATTISAGQWGYLGALDQSLSTTDEVNFAQVIVDTLTINNTSLGASGQLDLAAADAINIVSSGGAINLAPSGDVDDYITITTVGDIPQFDTVGGSDIRIATSLLLGDDSANNFAITFDGGDADLNLTAYDDAGGYITFDGTEEFAEIADTADLDMDDDYVIALWFKTTSLANTRMMGKQADPGGGLNGFEVRSLLGVNQIRFTEKFGGATTETTADGFWSDDKWHNLVMIHDKDGNNDIYIDGVIAGTGAAGNNNLSNTGKFILGADWDEDQWFPGSISHVAMYDSLDNFDTAAKVLEDYNWGRHKGVLRNDADLVAYWKMEAITAGDTTIEDDSGNGYDLTTNNMTQVANVFDNDTIFDFDADSFIDGNHKITGELRASSLYIDGDTIIGGDGDNTITHNSDGDLYFKNRSAAGVLQTAMHFDSSANSVVVDNGLDHQGSQLGFYGAGTTAQDTVTGSKAGNAALTSLLNALSSNGLIVDSTT